jgi:hypothetical protein
MDTINNGKFYSHVFHRAEDGEFYIPSLAYGRGHGEEDRHFSCDESGWSFVDGFDFGPSAELFQVCADGTTYEEVDGPWTCFTALAEAAKEGQRNAHVVWVRVLAWDADFAPTQLLFTIIWL